MSRKISLTEVNAMNNKQLKATLKKMITDSDKTPDGDGDGDRDGSGAGTGDGDQDGVQDLGKILLEILNEVKKMNAYRVQTDQQISELKDSNELLRKTLAQQQRFLEGLDADKRASNIIMLGVPEKDLVVDDQTAKDDEQKWAMIKSAIGCDGINHSSIIRLGRPTQGSCRPLKIVLTRDQDRPTIIERAKDLLTANAALKDIKIKKDTHPAVRKEYARLHQVEKKEKDKPENVGRTVAYNHQQRAILVDGKIVDSFMPTFF